MSPKVSRNTHSSFATSPHIICHQTLSSLGLVLVSLPCRLPHQTEEPSPKHHASASQRVASDILEGHLVLVFREPVRIPSGQAGTLSF